MKVRPPARAVRAALMMLGAAVLAAGCSNGVNTLSFPSPVSVRSTLPQGASATLPAGLASAPEGRVPGVTTTTVPAVGPGPATLNGTVLGPAGPVAGATVEADRLVGDSVATATATTAADGSWSFRNVLGGRYRVRAWKAPDLDLIAPQIVFLDTASPQSLNLQLAAYPGPQVTAAINPAAPVQGQPANLVVQVVNPSVAPNGVLSYQPVAGAAVTLVDGTGWQVNGVNPAPADANGQALFSVTCTVTGPDPLSAQVAGAPPVDLKMPACAAPAPATTETVPPGNPGPGSTTTTTCPYSGFGPPTSYQPNATTTTLAYGNC